MAIITLAEALRQLNIDEVPADTTELDLYVAAANEWVEERVTDTSPAPVKLATLMLLDHLWETQRGPSATPLDVDTGAPTGLGYAVPNRVLELLGPYMTTAAQPTGSFPDAVAWPDPVEWPA